MKIKTSKILRFNKFFSLNLQIFVVKLFHYNKTLNSCYKNFTLLLKQFILD